MVLALLPACQPPVVPDPLAGLADEVDEQIQREPMTVLLEATAHHDSEVRALALSWLIRDANPDEMATFAAIGLSDASPWVRKKAVTTLSHRLPDPVALAAISHAAGPTETDPYVFAEAAVALDGYASPDIEESIRQRLFQAGVDWGAAAIALAASAHGIEGAESALCTALEHGEIDYEPQWLRSLTAHSSPCIAMALKLASPRVEPEIALPIQWVRLLRGELKPERLIRQLMQLDTHAQLEFLDLVTEDDLAPAQALFKSLQTQTDPVVRAYARLLLSEVDMNRTYAAEVLALASSEDTVLRAMAIDSAGRCLQRLASQKGHRVCVSVVMDGLHDPVALVRRQAAEAAESLSPPPEAIQELRSDPLSWNRVQAAGILVHQETLSKAPPL